MGLQRGVKTSTTEVIRCFEWRVPGIITVAVLSIVAARHVSCNHLLLIRARETGLKSIGFYGY